jgi:hypothetical protein
MTAAENDVNVWKQTHEECELVVRAKGVAVAPAKPRAWLSPVRSRGEVVC